MTQRKDPSSSAGGGAELELDLRRGTRASPQDPDRPFRILVVGDLSGRLSRGLCAPQELSSRSPLRVDRDDFEDVLASLEARIDVRPASGEEAVIPLAPRELDDLHPDRLLERVELFERLRGLRRRLLDPATSGATAAELLQGRTTRPVAPPSPRPAQEAPANPLEAALAATEGRELERAPASSGSELVDELVREAARPHVEPRRSPEAARLVEELDRSAGEHMRALLRDPGFREVEAAWRVVHLLVRRLELDEQLQLYLLDATREELARDLGDAPAPEQSGLARLLERAAARMGEGPAFALVLGLQTFEATREDAGLLSKLGRLAQRAGAPWIAAAAPSHVGVTSFSAGGDTDAWRGPAEGEAEAAWSALRTEPGARWLALAAPGFLLRWPYGNSSSPTEHLPFEELAPGEELRHLPWGSGAALLALLLGQGFTARGWAPRPTALGEVDDLPLCPAPGDDEPRAAEVALDDRAAGKLLARGITPLRSVRGRAAVRVESLRSLSSADPRLAGPWTT